MSSRIADQQFLHETEAMRFRACFQRPELLMDFLERLTNAKAMNSFVEIQKEVSFYAFSTSFASDIDSCFQINIQWNFLCFLPGYRRRLC
jgi:hypothetical protein